jgi:hypothetical protein
MENQINPQLRQASPITQEEPEHTQENLKAQVAYVKHGKPLIHHLIAIFLGIQSLYGLFTSIKFILFERIIVEESIHNNALTETDINQLLGKTVLTLIGTAISLFFAVRISFLKTKTAENLQTIIGLLLIIANGFLMGLISQLPLLDRVMTLFNF